MALCGDDGFTSIPSVGFLKNSSDIRTKTAQAPRHTQTDRIHIPLIYYHQWDVSFFNKTETF